MLILNVQMLLGDAVAAELHFILEPFLLRRTKTEVLVDLPTKSEMILYTSLSNVQKNLYKSILTKDLSAFGESGNKTRLLNVMSQLRKCINHPYLFDGIEPEPFELGEHLIEASGKLFIIDKLLQLLKANGHRVLIFSQMTRMLDIMQDYLGYRGYSYDRLDGSIRGEERFLAVQNFTDDTDVFVFLLSTRAGGQGLNLVGADTILFIDSDFNPQNDLQAAARAHRIGQTKPVKIIRLVTRDTAEEIILRRAQAKLSLTEKVIEGGQFSLGASNSVAESTSQLSEILKFGLDKILAENESSLECEDLESIIGYTDANGCWIMDTDVPIEEEESEQGPDTIYMYEGKDYSNASKDDQKKFDELLAAQLTFVVKGSDERVLRSEQRISLATPISELSTRKRAPLTQEQLEERKRKREENRIKKQKLLEEAERKRQEEKERKKKEWWNKNNYISLNMDLPSSDEEEEEDDDGNDNDIVYLIGDVTHPQNTGNKNAIVVHCTDDSGRWGRGGLFSAISNRSLVPEEHYKLAGKMKDLSLGDAHLISIDDLMSRQEGKDYLALVVAQCRNEGAGKSSGIKLPALTTAFKRISHGALQQDASVHLPRIGHTTPNFNWYGTERLIRKYLARRGIPTYVYPTRICEKLCLFVLNFCSVYSLGWFSIVRFFCSVD
jgi:superfamily II DNA/RNA helicase